MSDGLNESLFHLLWAKDDVFDSGTKALIPDTIIFQNYQPRFWYFTSNDGTIKKKKKESLNLTKITQEFLKKPNPCGIVAMIYYMHESTRHIEYLTPDSLLNLNSEHRFLNEMILQKFIPPVGESNNCLTLIWTTNFCLFEKKENNLKLRDERYEPYEKACTFDGKDHHVTTSPLRSTVLPNRLLKMSNSIVSHVAAVTFEKMKVIRMVLHVKLADDGKLWLLCATSIRFSSDDLNLPVDLNPNIQPPLEKTQPNVKLNNKNTSTFIKFVRCASCLKEFERMKIVELKYKDILKNKSQNLTPLFNLHPSLTISDIKKLNSKSKFQSKTLNMCFDCYLSFSEVHESVKTSKEAISANLSMSKNKMISNSYLSNACFSTNDVKTSRSYETLPSIISPPLSLKRSVYSLKSPKSEQRLFTTNLHN